MIRTRAPQTGFNGQLHEPVTAWQLLGNGYRAYNPVLMRFHRPDDLSPFERGGINTYAYCGDDPLNRMDPSGHFAIPWGWIAVGGGTALAAGAAAVAVVANDKAVKGVMATLAAISVIAAGVAFVGATSTGETILKRMIGRRAPRRIDSTPTAPPSTPPLLSKISRPSVPPPPPPQTPRSPVTGAAGRMPSKQPVARTESASSMDSILARHTAPTQRSKMQDDLLSNNVYSKRSIRRMERRNRELRGNDSISSASSTSSLSDFWNRSQGISRWKVRSADSTAKCMKPVARWGQFGLETAGM
jgi:RHS repeat-associated protein